MQINEVMWLHTSSDRPVGIVKAWDEIEEHVKFYIGTGIGRDQEEDVQYIMDWGQKFCSLDFLRAFIGGDTTEEQLQAQLREERYRHDRYVDFEMAQAKELAALRRERDAMLARLLYLGEGCELCQHNGKVVCNDDVDCTACRQDCICRDCGGNSNFVWKGEKDG